MPALFYSRLIVPPGRARATVLKFGSVARARPRQRRLEASFYEGACIIRDFGYYVAVECSESGLGPEEDCIDWFQRATLPAATKIEKGTR